MCASCERCMPNNGLRVGMRMMRVSVNDAVFPEVAKPALAKPIIVARRQIAAELVNSDLKNQLRFFKLSISGLTKRTARKKKCQPQRRASSKNNVFHLFPHAKKEGPPTIISFRWPQPYLQLSFLLFRSTRFLHLLHHLVNAEAGWLLTRRELLKRCEEIADIGLRGHQEEYAVDHPVVNGVLRRVPDRRRVGAVLQLHRRPFRHFDVEKLGVVGGPSRRRNLDDANVVQGA